MTVDDPGEGVGNVLLMVELLTIFRLFAQYYLYYVWECPVNWSH